MTTTHDRATREWADEVERVAKRAGRRLEADVKSPARRARVMPAQRPGQSEQVVVTPMAFIDAVEARFGEVAFDLAATFENARVRGRKSTKEGLRHLGPGSALKEDSLRYKWRNLPYKFDFVDGEPIANLWCNPPFGLITPWVAKAAKTVRRGFRGRGRILVLVPASVGTAWWREYVHHRAAVKFLAPRLVFEGHSNAYPKDLALCVYSPFDAPGYECWRWDIPYRAGQELVGAWAKEHAKEKAKTR